MRKLLFLVPIGLLVIWMGGCSSDSANNQASPTPSTSPSGASPSTAATGKAATPSPTASLNLPFASPLVTPKSNGSVAATGLTRSTNPEERAKQAESGNSKNTPILPTDRNANQDPFAVLPPQTVQNAPIAQSGSGSMGSLLPKLPNRQVPKLPALPIAARPVQIGGKRLTGADAAPIRLSATERGIVNEFTTLQALLDDTTKQSEYNSDLGEVGDSIFNRDTRRELLLSNRRLYRRFEKVYQEYDTASDLWSLYGEKADPDALRCSIVPAIAEAIQVYRPPTQRLGQLQCVKRIDMLQAVWRRGKNVLDAALRDQDFDGPTIAKAPKLPVLPDVPQRVLAPGEKALGRDIASVPSVPVIRPPQLGRRPGAGRIDPPSLPEIPPAQAPALPDPAERKSPLRWDNPNQRPPGGPGYQRRPGSKPGQPGAPLPPPPPSTDIAQAIEISGVVQVGNQIQIIVKVPTEATTRYVKVGQRIANGQVLIKRVEFRRDGDPVVILEQNGVEVAKVVGEKPPEPDKKAG